MLAKTVPNLIMGISMRKTIVALGMVAWVVGLMTTGCRSGSNNMGKEDRAVIDAGKPAVDTTKVIALVDLYRAKRYEDLQSAMADGPEQVYKLSFHGRKLASLPADIARFTYLASLDVANNDLSVLPEELSELHYLQGFYANGNRLTEFPEQILLLPLLERVNLSDNQIPAIPEALVRMDQLTSLALENNTITELPVQVYELENLGVLNLAGNGLTVIPGGISQLTALKKLDLSYNQISTIPREIAGMGNHLSELMVHGNRIPREEIEWLMEAMPQTKIRF